MALHIAQDHSGPSWWQLWVCLWVLCLLWWCWSSIYFDFYATHVMSTFSALSRFFYTSLWLELYWWQVSVPLLTALSKQCSLKSVVIIKFFFSCELCHSNKLESLFECPVSRLLYDEGEVDYWMYEPVDLTEQSAFNAATGSTMQGRHTIFGSLKEHCFSLISTYGQTYSTVTLPIERHSS